jgi:hypothetical protein
VGGGGKPGAAAIENHGHDDGQSGGNGVHAQCDHLVLGAHGHFWPGGNGPRAKFYAGPYCLNGPAQDQMLK